MITTIDHGTYTLVETSRGTKLLELGNKKYAWIMARQIGSLLIWSGLIHKVRDTLSSGNYYLFSVEDEPHLSDQLHLELEIGQDAWQGYLLPTGLPTREDPKHLIIPTHEVINGRQLSQNRQQINS